jgi:hypothetical protein
MASSNSLIRLSLVGTSKIPPELGDPLLKLGKLFQ